MRACVRPERIPVRSSSDFRSCFAQTHQHGPSRLRSDGWTVTLSDRLVRRDLEGRFCAASAAMMRAPTCLRSQDLGSRKPGDRNDCILRGRVRGWLRAQWVILPMFMWEVGCLLSCLTDGFARASRACWARGAHTDATAFFRTRPPNLNEN